MKNYLSTIDSLHCLKQLVCIFSKGSRIFFKYTEQRPSLQQKKKQTALVTSESIKTKQNNNKTKHKRLCK